MYTSACCGYLPAPVSVMLAFAASVGSIERSSVRIRGVGVGVGSIKELIISQLTIEKQISKVTRHTTIRFIYSLRKYYSNSMVPYIVSARSYLWQQSYSENLHPVRDRRNISSSAKILSSFWESGNQHAY